MEFAYYRQNGTATPDDIDGDHHPSGHVESPKAPVTIRTRWISVECLCSRAVPRLNPKK